MFDDAADERFRGLMRAAQDGDRAAYASLLRELAGPLRAFCRRRLPTQEDAEDTVQEVLVTLHRARATFDPSRPFRPWIVTIARRRIADRLALIRRIGPASEIDEAAEVTSATAEANTYEGELTGEELRAAIAALPPGQRQALELTKLKELSLAEASAESGLSITALKVATHRAVASLKRRFAGKKDVPE